MKNKKLIGTSLLASAFMIQQASAQFTLVDDFNSYANGNLSGQGPWGNSGVANSVTVLNGAAVIGNVGSAPTYRPIPTIVNSSTAATFFGQFTLGAVGGSGSNNFNIILTDVAAPADTAGSSEVQFNFDSTSSRLFAARNGGSFLQLSTDGVNIYNPLASVTYNLWFEVNNSTDTYQVFLQGGDILSRTMMSSITAVSTFGFRNGAAANSLTTVNIGMGGATGNAGGQTLDNFYVDATGFNPANPTTVPEPSAFALLGFSGLALVYRMRRHNN